MRNRVDMLMVGVVAAMLFAAGRAVAADDSTALKGQPAPDFALKTLDGKDVKLSDMKGKVTVIDFWATWCPPCRKSLPHIQKIATDGELAKKGLYVWAVNAQETNEKAEPFMKENKYTFTVPMDRGGAAMNSYRVTGIPTTVVVGRDGIIKEVFVGFGEGSEEMLDKAVKQALDEKAK